MRCGGAPTERLNVSSAVDKLEGELMGELENARLVRLLCKFGFINERPECVLLFFSPSHLHIVHVDDDGD